MADPSETTQVSLEPKDAESAELLNAVRALSAQVSGLQSELQTLRAQSRQALPGTASHGWEDGGAQMPVGRSTSQWVRSLEGPSARPPAIPRLLLEIVFLVAVAVAATIAELDPVVIVVLMAGAWALVAVAEYLAARAAQSQAEVFMAPLAGATFADDRSWFGPPVERAILDTDARDTTGENTEGDAETVARLPPRSSE
jgi:hypothetical protein